MYQLGNRLRRVPLQCCHWQVTWGKYGQQEQGTLADAGAPGAYLGFRPEWQHLWRWEEEWLEPTRAGGRPSGKSQAQKRGEHCTQPVLEGGRQEDQTRAGTHCVLRWPQHHPNLKEEMQCPSPFPAHSPGPVWIWEEGVHEGSLGVHLMGSQSLHMLKPGHWAQFLRFLQPQTQRVLRTEQNWVGLDSPGFWDRGACLEVWWYLGKTQELSICVLCAVRETEKYKSQVLLSM